MTEMMQATQTETRTETTTGRTPLYGHTSPETAYVVGDYPYGYRERTTIRYWLEDGKKRGFRRVSQTINPKTGRWNAPKASTYSLLASAMYLDARGHVQWAALSEYSEAAHVVAFVRAFPGADLSRLPAWCRAKVALCERFAALHAEGRSGWAINGVPTALKPEDVSRNAAEIATWREAVAALAALSPNG
jgi:hypothetical protein